MVCFVLTVGGYGCNISMFILLYSFTSGTLYYGVVLMATEIFKENANGNGGCSKGITVLFYITYITYHIITIAYHNIYQFIIQLHFVEYK